jgi:hypothetical protein
MGFVKFQYQTAGHFCERKEIRFETLILPGVYLAGMSLSTVELRHLRYFVAVVGTAATFE